MTEWLAGWLLNYLMHSTVLLGGVWAIERAGWLKHPAWREAFWRWAFFGAVLTASLQPLLHGTRLTLPVEATALIGSLAGIGEIAKATFGEAAVAARRSGSGVPHVDARPS